MPVEPASRRTFRNDRRTALSRRTRDAEAQPQLPGGLTRHYHEAIMPSVSDDTQDQDLARLAVELGLTTQEEVRDCLELQKQRSNESGEIRSLGQLMVDNGLITAKQRQRLQKQVQNTGRQQIPGYQLLERLGAGANATVYKARQLSLDRVVAIKVLPRRATRNARYVEAFYAEGRAAARLNHANIVGALDVNKAGDFHYFVMEHVEGHTVFDELQENIRYAEDEAVHIVLQIARGLAHAHQAGIIHRDVKPQNMVITTEGVAKLLDLGLAHRPDIDAEPESGRAIGSPYYMAPEQILADPNIDHRADVYGLGATLYLMVTGQPPYDAPTAKGVMRAHLDKPLTPPKQINPLLSDDVCKVIEVCLAKRKEDRYEPTQQLVEDLEALDSGESPLHASIKIEDDMSGNEPAKPAAAETKSSDPRAGQASEVASYQTPTSAWEEPYFKLAITGWIVAFTFVILCLILVTTGG